MILLTALGIAGFGTTALASDGVLEINQTCAVQTGCFAGDTAGLPVEISASGSYRLTSNLVVPDENTNGITVGADNVSIDLGGFEILGPVNCTGTPIICAPSSGVGSGVHGVNSAISGTSVRNGSIRGMGSSGVNLGVQSEATHLRVRSNRLQGISTGNGSTIAGNTAYRNRGDGISASAGSTVSGNAAHQNGDDGILTGVGSTVSGNSSYDNEGDGIQTSSGSSVLGNTVRLNTGYGLNLATHSGYRENVISANTAGTVTGSDLVNLGNNACNGSATCP